MGVENLKLGFVDFQVLKFAPHDESGSSIRCVAGVFEPCIFSQISPRTILFLICKDCHREIDFEEFHHRFTLKTGLFEFTFRKLGQVLRCTVVTQGCILVVRLPYLSESFFPQIHNLKKVYFTNFKKVCCGGGAKKFFGFSSI